MKLRTSFFNPTVFKKDLTRFAPTWVLYTIGLFMMMAICLDAPSDYRRAQSIADTISLMAGFNLCYGLLNAQLLFGDLFNSRHVNALHAMPLRRECWYFTHMVSGLAFSFVPNLVMALVASLMMGTGWMVPFWWLLAVTLQYVCFFGLAVLSALCVGNRFAMVLVYGIINFLSLIIYWFYSSIYEPLLYGVVVDAEKFNRFCPVSRLVDLGYEMLVINGTMVSGVFKTLEFGEGWGYLGICAAVGVAALVLSLILYRRRKLESAGDFMAVRALEPVFLGLYTISMASYFWGIGELFDLGRYIFLGLGVIIGFFTGRMLLNRTIRVFQPKALLAFAVVCVVFAGSMVMTAVDPLGVTRRVPKAQQVACVYITPSQYNFSGSSVHRMEDSENIEKAVALHRAILDGKTTAVPLEDDTSVCISYVLKNGKTIRRYYTGVDINSEAGQLVKYFYNRTEYILNGKPEDVVKGLKNVYFIDYMYDHNANLPAHIGQGLMEAVIADCEAGVMNQHWVYRAENTSVGWMEFEWVNEQGQSFYTSVEIPENAVNTIAYLEETVYPWLEVNSY